MSRLTDAPRLVLQLGFSLVVAALAIAPAAAPAQTGAPSASAPGMPMIYPAKGQSPDQMASDKGECYGWAQKQTGYNPATAMQAQGQPQQQPQQGGAAKGAAKGAAAGAAIGAIAGSPGTGAAAGATAGGVGGASKKRKAQAAQQQSMAQQQAATDQQLSNFKRAFGACMEGRGYTVK